MTQLLVKLFIKNNENVTDSNVRQQYGVLGGAVGIGCNLLLFICKLFAGIMTGAISITADAFNNLSDAGSSVVTLIGFKMAGKPADIDHPFGHGRIEYLSGLFVSVAIMLVGWELGKTSFSKIMNPLPVTYTVTSVIILIGSVVLKLWMSVFNKSLGKRINSAAMKATAADSLSDCVATSAVLISIAVGYVTGLHIDGYAGMVVAIFIFWAGVGAARDTLRPILGQAPDLMLVKGIEDVVMDHEEIVGIHDMIVHDYGPGRVMVSLHAEIPCAMDFLCAHDVIDEIEYQIKDKFNCEVTIHMDPVSTDDQVTNEIREHVETIVKELHEEMSLHDFRMTQGPLHMNLIFDVQVPFHCKMTEEEVKTMIRLKVKELDKNYFAVINIDKGFV